MTVGDAYRNRGESAAAQRVYQRAVDEGAPVLRPDDLQLLTARVRAADYNLIVSSAASQSLDSAIEILRTKGAIGADLLIDALLVRARSESTSAFRLSPRRSIALTHWTKPFRPRGASSATAVASI